MGYNNPNYMYCVECDCMNLHNSHSRCMTCFRKKGDK